MRARLLVVPVLLAAGLTVTSSGAAPAPLLVDPKGDYPVAAADIVSANISTVTVGTKGRLLITLSLAAPVGTTPYSYRVSFIARDCLFSAVVYNHPFAGVFSTSGVGCQVAGQTSLPEGSFKMKAETITWTVPLTGDLKKGVTLTDITAGTVPSGMLSGGAINTLGDTGSTNKTYKIGR